VGALYAYRLSELRTSPWCISILDRTTENRCPPLKPGAGEWAQTAALAGFRHGLEGHQRRQQQQGLLSERVCLWARGPVEQVFPHQRRRNVYRTTLPAVGGVTGAANGTLRHELFIGPSIDVDGPIGAAIDFRESEVELIE